MALSTERRRRRSSRRFGSRLVSCSVFVRLLFVIFRRSRARAPVPPPQSGLERDALRSIWMLVDTDRDNRLSAHEVGCALSSYIFALSRLFAFFD